MCAVCPHVVLHIVLKYVVKPVASQGLISLEKVVCTLIHAVFRLIEVVVTVGSESELSLHPEAVGRIQ